MGRTKKMRVGIYDKDGKCRWIDDKRPSFIGKVLVQECGMKPRIINTARSL